jgi:predicted ArsR family transcriptional regulator
MRNCPFHAVAQRHPEVVCDMNLALLGALVAGRDVGATLEPGPGRCCVALRPR